MHQNRYKRRLSTTFALLSTTLVPLAIGCATPSDRADPADSTQTTNQAVTGGQLETRFPAVGYVSKLLPSNGGTWDNVCTGTLLGSNAVLTAAHCVDDHSHFMYKFDIGPVDLHAGIPVKSIHIHPKYDRVEDLASHDLAVLILSRNVQQSVSFPVLRDIKPHLNKTHLLVGYGLHGNQYNQRRSATVTPISAGINGGYQIGITGVSGMACEGDSGGPLLSMDGAALYGVVTGGDSCATDGTDIYADAYADKQFVYSAIGARSFLVYSDPSLPPAPPTTGTPVPGPADVAPNILMLQPDNASTVSGVVHILADANDVSGAVWMDFLVNGQYVWGDATSPFEVPAWDTRTVPNGATILQAIAWNPAGLSSLATIQVTVNNQPPVATMLGGGAVVSSGLDLHCVVSGFSVQSYSYYVDGALVSTAAWPNQVWDSHGVADGWHDISCSATDAGNLTGYSAPVQIYVQNAGGVGWRSPAFRSYTGTAAAPLVILEAMSDEANTEFAEITSSSHANAMGICQQTYPLNTPGSTTLTCNWPRDPGRSGMNIQGLNDGVVNLTYHTHQTYPMGSGNYSLGRSFYIDNTPPLIALDPVETKVLASNQVQLRATSPTASHLWAEFPDNIVNVEFFAQLPTGGSVSLGAVPSVSGQIYWQRTADVPAEAIVNGVATVFAVATDAVLAERTTVVNRTGTSATKALTLNAP